MDDFLLDEYFRRKWRFGRRLALGRLFAKLLVEFGVRNPA
jgi:hypothetical protein